MPKAGASVTSRVFRNSAETHAISIVTAMGSVPLHLIPLVVAVLVADKGFSAMSASLTITVALAANLGVNAILALSAIRVDRRDILLPVLALFALAIACSEPASNSAAIYPLWALIGVLSGIIGQAGSVFSAYAKHPEQVFALRLSYVLALSGLSVLAILLPLPIPAFARMTGAVALISVTAMFCLLKLPRPSGTQRRLIRAAPTPPTPLMVLGLLALMFIMLAFTAFLSQIGSLFDRGSNGGLFKVILIVGIGKLIIGGLVSLAFALLGLWSLRKQVLISVATTVAILCLTISDQVVWAIFFFAMLELTLNTFSPLFNGRLAAILNDYWKHWISFSVLLGALAGPPVGVWLVELDPDYGTAGLAILSLIAAATWAAATKAPRSQRVSP